MAEEFDFQSTADIKVPEQIISQVLGQVQAVEIIKKPGHQLLHV